MTTTDLGWIATVTGHCNLHDETETWGIKGATRGAALAGMAEAATDLTLGHHHLATWAPTVGKIYPMPTTSPSPTV